MQAYIVNIFFFFINLGLWYFYYFILTLKDATCVCLSGQCTPPLIRHNIILVTIFEKIAAYIGKIGAMERVHEDWSDEGSACPAYRRRTRRRHSRLPSGNIKNAYFKRSFADFSLKNCGFFLPPFSCYFKRR